MRGGSSCLLLLLPRHNSPWLLLHTPPALPETNDCTARVFLPRKREAYLDAGRQHALQNCEAAYRQPLERLKKLAVFVR